MLNRNDRIIVEAVRRASGLKIGFVCHDEIVEIMDEKFNHDVAIALQDFFNRNNP